MHLELPSSDIDDDSPAPASPESARSQRYAVCGVVETPDHLSMGKIDPLLELDAGTVDSFRTALLSLRRHMQFDLLQLAYLNMKGHGDVLDRLMHSTADPLGLVRQRTTESAQMILGNLFNFCSSIHAVQDHSQARAQRLGGDELRTQVHGLFSDAYDTGDELFFIRKLRDVLVHSDFGVFDYETSYFIEEPGAPPLARSQTYFVRSTLLSQRRFNTRILDWISGHDERFPIFPVLEAAFDQLYAIYADVLQLTNPQLFEDAALVSHVCQVIVDALGSTADLLIYPATPDLRPDEGRHDLILPLYPEVIAYARVLVSDGSEVPAVV